MIAYPYRWFTNIAGLLEKRRYSVVTIFLFAFFVGALRRFFEWALGGVAEPFPLSFLVTLTGFYWFAFFLMAGLLKLLVPQPWRVSINVVLVGIFLGIFPPVIDLLATGPGFKYAYVWSAPERFHWYLYNPELNIPIGEAAVLWAVVLFTALYVWVRTRSAARAGLALAGAYACVIVLGGVLAGTAKLMTKTLGWQPTHQIALVNQLQILAALGVYVLLQPIIARRMFAAAVRSLPLVALFAAGAAFAGAFSVTVAVYAAVLGVLLAAQIDPVAPADDEDARFLGITQALLLTALAAANASVLAAFTLLVAAGLPVVRARGGAPLAALRAFAAVAAGMAAAAEAAAFGAPRWWIAFLPEPASAPPAGALELGLLAAAAAAAYFVATLRTGTASPRPDAGSPVLQAAATLVVVSAAQVVLEGAAAGRYPPEMLIALLTTFTRVSLALLAVVLAARAGGVSLRAGGPAALRLVWVMLVPPIAAAAGLPHGEVAAAVLLAAAPVWLAARAGAGAARTIAAAASAVLAVPLLVAGPGRLAAWLCGRVGWPAEHGVALTALLQVAAVFFAYLALRPRLARGLAARLPHVLPFLLFGLLGAAFQGGELSATAAAYALLLVFGGWISLGQNDYFDTEEDTLQGRARYLGLEDVRLLTLVSWLLLAGLAAAHSAATFAGAMAVATYLLYNFPFYRGKRYFPTNLKIEGVWGFCAFAFGVVGAFEQSAYGAPRWWVTHSPPLPPAAEGPFPIATIAALFLAFGGFSLVALLKDYKDVDADRAAGVQTLYTVLTKRGVALARVHGVALGLCAAAVAAAPVLLALAGKAAWAFVPGGAVAALVVWGLMRGAPSQRRFRYTLFTLTLYFAYLTAALTAGGA